MRAAVYHRPGAALTIEQVATPRTSTGDLVIKVRCCGICGSDLHMADMHGPGKRHGAAAGRHRDGP